MKRFKVVSGVLPVSQGARLQLSEAQAASRSHKLEAVKGRKGTYVASAPLQFKTGEELGLEEVAKPHLHQVEEVGAGAEG